MKREIYFNGFIKKLSKRKLGNVLEGQKMSIFKVKNCKCFVGQKGVLIMELRMSMCTQPPTPKDACTCTSLIHCVLLNRWMDGWINPVCAFPLRRRRRVEKKGQLLKAASASFPMLCMLLYLIWVAYTCSFFIRIFLFTFIHPLIFCYAEIFTAVNHKAFQSRSVNAKCSINWTLGVNK